jgi:hypothetical protein
MAEQQDHEAKLAAPRAASDQGDACDPATDIDIETSSAVMKQYINNRVAKSGAETPAVDERPTRRPSGLFKGTLGPGFFEPLPEEELRLWNGEGEDTKPEVSDAG